MYFIFRLFGHQVWRKVSVWWRNISDSHIYSTNTIVGGMLTADVFIFRLFSHQVWRKVSVWWRNISDSHIYSTDTIVGGMLTTDVFYFQVIWLQVWSKVSVWWRSISDSHIYSTSTIVGSMLIYHNGRCILFTGYLATKFGGKYLFGGGVFLTAIFTLLTPLCARWNVYLLITVRVLEGLFEVNSTLKQQSQLHQRTNGLAYEIIWALT